MNCFRFVNFMNNTMIINSFNSDNSNIAIIETQNCQIMTIITYRILKLDPMIKNRQWQIMHYLLFLLLVIKLNINVWVLV